MKQSNTRIISYSLISVFVGFAAIELLSDALYLLNRIRFQFSSQTQNQPNAPQFIGTTKWIKDSYLRGRFVTSQKGVSVNSQPVAINAHGFRGKPLRDKSFKIASMGDSVTWGWDNDDKHSYPQQLEEQLRNPNIQVINAGVPRWTSIDHLKLFLTMVQKHRPKIVTLLPGWNDIFYQFSPPKPIKAAPLWARLGEVAKSTFSSVRLLDYLLTPIISWVPAQAQIHESVLRNRDFILSELSKSQHTDEIHWEFLSEYKQILTAFALLVRSADAIPVFITMPHFMRPNIDEERKLIAARDLLAHPNISIAGWYQMIERTNKATREISEKHGIILVEAHDKIPHHLFTDICHLNDEGNAILAKLIATSISPLISL